MRPILFVALGLITFSSVAIGEDPSRGRLPDGRAFRVDSEGTQLVDYIAELELNIDSLNKRVAGLEGEVEEKQQAIDRFKANGGTASTISEKSLLGQNVSNIVVAKKTECPPAPTLECPRVEQVQCPRNECPKFECPKIDSPNCQVMVDKAVDPLNTMIDSLESRLHEVESTKDEQVQRKEAELNAVRAQLERSNSDISSLQAKLSDAEAKIVAKVQDQGRASLNLARSKAVDVVKSSMLSDLSKLSSLARQRDGLFRQYRSGAKSSGLISLSPSTLVSSRGHSIEFVKNRLENAQNISELSVLKRDIADIRYKVEQDISFVNRMGKK